MKTYATREVPAYQTKITSLLTCDICGFERPNPRGWSSDLEWGDSSDDINKTSVSRSDGYNCPSGGAESGVEYHICPKCFIHKLEPWLQSQGAKPTKTEVDW